MAENNQNEPTYEVTSHTAKKGRSRTYILKDLKGKEKFVLIPGSNLTVDPAHNLSSIQDTARINLFANDYAGNPLNRNYSYYNFHVANDKTSIRLLSEGKEKAGQYYYIRAYKKFEKRAASSANLLKLEVLLPNNRINIQGGPPSIDEFTNQPHYFDSNGLAYTYKGEYKANDGAIPFITNNNSLINLPSREEYIYIAFETPAARIEDENFDFLSADSNTSLEEKLVRNFMTPSHMTYVLFGSDTSVANVVNHIKNSSFYQQLSNRDKFAIDGNDFASTLVNSEMHYFSETEVYTHMDFIADIPFSPKMVRASGLATEKMLTANISSEFNFMPPELKEIISSNNFLELELPNFYNFITAMVAAREKRFDPNNINAQRLTLHGKIDPSQLLLVGRQYDDYQAFSQLPPGHYSWDYENEKSILGTDFNVEAIDYWQAWSNNWTEYNNEKAEIPTSQYPMQGLLPHTILIPYENTNFLRDYNDNITYFPHYNQIEFDSPKELPILPQILKNANADKYVMRCLAANLDVSLNETISLQGIGKVEAKLESAFQINRDSPPGEEADLLLDPKQLGSGFYNAGDIDDTLVSDLDVKSWDLSDLINGFKEGEEGWATANQDIQDYDNRNFYVGIDIENGYPFPNDLSMGTLNQKFTKSIYSHILEQQLQSLAAQKILSYSEIQCGAKNYSELVMFRIHKKNTQDINGETEQNIWMWNTSDIDRYIYYDTQVGYGQSYQYKVYAYYFVIGNRYKYHKPNAAQLNQSLGFSNSSEFEDPNSLDKAVVELKIANQVMMKIVEVPYFGHEEASQNVTVAIDDPPVPPSVKITPFKNVPDSISMTLTNNSGEYETNKVVSLLSERPGARDVPGGAITNYLYASDDDVLHQMYHSQNKVDDMDLKPSIKFKSDTMPAFYEVYRIGPDPGETETDPPTSYASFFDKLHTIIEIEGSSETIIDDIQENTVYYYTFRSRDGASGYFFSNPTAVYKVQLVREPGKNVVYPIIEVYDMEMDKKYRVPSKQMTRYMHIKPAYEHTVLNEGEDELQSLAQFHDKTTTNPGDTPHVPKLGVNNDNYELFSVTKANAKRFKIRLTSKSTGRKIDFNVAFLRKHNQD